jgi:superfamily II RNA helicase
LQKENFVVTNEEGVIQLTFSGKIACQLREIPCLIFAKLLEDKSIDNLSSKQLVSLLSCFTNINVQDDLKANIPISDDKIVKELATKVTELYKKSQDKETKNNINTGTDYNIHYDLLNYTGQWCEAESVEDCKILLQKIADEKEIFLGEFVKALLKINNISQEMEKIAEMTNNIAFLSRLKEIPNMTLKYVVTNQSLYV